MQKISYSSYQRTLKGGHTESRIRMLTFFISAVFLVIFLRLFQLQVLQGSNYKTAAKEQQFGAVDLPAKRGDIYVKDTHSGELSKLATNTTLDLLYIDPNVDPDNPMSLEDKKNMVDRLIPLIFTREDYETCRQNPDDCFYDIEQKENTETLIITDTIWDIELGSTNTVDRTLEEIAEFKSYETMIKDISEDIFSKISKKEVDFVVLKRDAEEELMADIINERLPGIFVDKDRFMIHADPTAIPANQLDEISTIIAGYLEEPPSKMTNQLRRRPIRYVLLKNKLSPETSKILEEFIATINEEFAKKRKANGGEGPSQSGIVLIPEHWRFYPEGDLASHLIGFINRENTGQYGIEGYFNVELEGKKGAIYSESDPLGRQITVGNTEIVNAVDGDTFVLTIDRVVQKKVEDILGQQVEEFNADSGQVIIMDPFSGAIIAMANYPSFDPNDFAESYTLRKLDLENDEKVNKTVPVFKKDERGKYIPIDDEDLDNDEIEKYIYENLFGPGVFKNKAISEFYEPGSTFKPLVMAIGLDAKEVSPETTFNDDGPIEIDLGNGNGYTIKNSDNQYHGTTTMTEVLEKSLNTGMWFVAEKLGKKIMYDYLSDFGFGQYTNINLEGETKGGIKYYDQWELSRHVNISFGQGLTVTPLQMVTAWSSLANGGKLMQPYIVDSVIREGEVIETEPEIIHRVISEETSSIISAMLVSSVRRGHGATAEIPGYLIAGKTGTAQIAEKGSYAKGEGSTITSFAGYFPAMKPRFVILVKFDRPRSLGGNTWGSTTAAPTFKMIAEFLIDYYNIEPESSS